MKKYTALLFVSLLVIAGCGMAPTKMRVTEKSKAEVQQTKNKQMVDQYEPNDSIEKAVKIEVNSEIKGTIYPRADKDFYKFTVDASKILKPTEYGKVVSIVMTNPTGKIKPVMIVHRPDGKITRGSWRMKTGKKRSNKLVAGMFPRSGDYFVEISDQKLGYSNKPYVLKVTTEEFSKEVTSK